MDSAELEKIRAKYKLKPAEASTVGAWKHKKIDGVEYQKTIRAEWERKPTTPPKPVKTKKDYYKISYEDLVFWVANANRTIFSDALTQYNKLKKRGVTLEIRWYKDRIDIHEL